MKRPFLTLTLTLSSLTGYLIGTPFSLAAEREPVFPTTHETVVERMIDEDDDICRSGMCHFGDGQLDGDYLARQVNRVDGNAVPPTPESNRGEDGKASAVDRYHDDYNYGYEPANLENDEPAESTADRQEGDGKAYGGDDYGYDNYGYEGDPGSAEQAPAQADQADGSYDAYADTTWGYEGAKDLSGEASNEHDSGDSTVLDYEYDYETYRLVYGTQDDTPAASQEREMRKAFDTAEQFGPKELPEVRTSDVYNDAQKHGSAPHDSLQPGRPEATSTRDIYNTQPHLRPQVPSTDALTTEAIYRQQRDLHATTRAQGPVQTPPEHEGYGYATDAEYGNQTEDAGTSASGWERDYPSDETNQDLGDGYRFGGPDSAKADGDESEYRGFRYDYDYTNEIESDTDNATAASDDELDPYWTQDDDSSRQSAGYDEQTRLDYEETTGDDDELDPYWREDVNASESETDYFSPYEDYRGEDYDAELDRSQSNNDAGDASSDPLANESSPQQVEYENEYAHDYESQWHRNSDDAASENQSKAEANRDGGYNGDGYGYDYDVPSADNPNESEMKESSNQPQSYDYGSNDEYGYGDDSARSADADEADTAGSSSEADAADSGSDEYRYGYYPTPASDSEATDPSESSNAADTYEYGSNDDYGYDYDSTPSSESKSADPSESSNAADTYEYGSNDDYGYDYDSTPSSESKSADPSESSNAADTYEYGSNDDYGYDYDSTPSSESKSADPSQSSNAADTYEYGSNDDYGYDYDSTPSSESQSADPSQSSNEADNDYGYGDYGYGDGDASAYQNEETRTYGADAANGEEGTAVEQGYEYGDDYEEDYSDFGADSSLLDNGTGGPMPVAPLVQIGLAKALGVDASIISTSTLREWSRDLGTVVKELGLDRVWEQVVDRYKMDRCEAEYLATRQDESVPTDQCWFDGCERWQSMESLARAQEARQAMADLALDYRREVLRQTSGALRSFGAVLQKAADELADWADTGVEMARPSTDDLRR